MFPFPFLEYGCIEVLVNVYSDEEAGVLVKSAELIMSDREYVVDPYYPWVSFTSSRKTKRNVEINWSLLVTAFHLNCFGKDNWVAMPNKFFLCIAHPH